MYVVPLTPDGTVTHAQLALPPQLAPDKHAAPTRQARALPRLARLPAAGANELGAEEDDEDEDEEEAAQCLYEQLESAHLHAKPVPAQQGCVSVHT